MTQHWSIPDGPLQAFQVRVCAPAGDATRAAEGMGHFGLAVPHYTHFTSPIRRYADLLVHRQLLKALALPPSQPPTPQAAIILAEGASCRRYPTPRLVPECQSCQSHSTRVNSYSSSWPVTSSG